MRTLCDESKYNLRTPLGQWILDDNKYITSWKWFPSRDIQTLYYREHETWCKYIRPPNRAHRCIDLRTYTKSKNQRPYCFQVCRIILTSSTPAHLQIEATGMDLPPYPSGTPLDSDKEEFTSKSKLRTDLKKTENQHKWLVSHLTFSDKLYALYSDFTSEEARAGINGSYRAYVGIISSSRIIESNRIG